MGCTVGPSGLRTRLKCNSALGKISHVLAKPSQIRTNLSVKVVRFSVAFTFSILQISTFSKNDFRPCFLVFDFFSKFSIIFLLFSSPLEPERMYHLLSIHSRSFNADAVFKDLEGCGASLRFYVWVLFLIFVVESHLRDFGESCSCKRE